MAIRHTLTVVHHILMAVHTIHTGEDHIIRTILMGDGGITRILTEVTEDGGITTGGHGFH
jgi:hypothetical protein